MSARAPGRRSGGADDEAIVAADAAEHAILAAELLARAIAEAVDARGVARVALSGGSTPSESYRRLADLALPWDAVELYWVDERAVPPDHPRSNYGAAQDDFTAAAIPHAQRFRMEADAPDLGAAAARYEALLRRRFGVASAIAFDAMTLGVGDDGHTASLFPGTGAADLDDRLVLAVPAQRDKGLEPRLTLTAPVIQEARLLLVLARGAGKRAMVAAARSDGPADEIPARVARAARGRVLWVLDEAAAGRAPEGAPTLH